MNPGVVAVKRLTALGYRFMVNGGIIKAKYEGPSRPDPAQVRPLLALVKEHKPAVVDFLRYYCPRCGGVVFVGNECFLCDWRPWAIREASQAQGPQVNAPTCGGCAHFIPSRLNPAQGFGRCALVHLSKRPGAFPGKVACPRFEPPVGEDSLRLAQ